MRQEITVMGMDMERGRVFFVLLFFVVCGSLGFVWFSASSFAPGIVFSALLLLSYQMLFSDHLLIKESVLLFFTFSFLSICLFSIFNFCVNIFLDFPRLAYSLISVLIIVFSLAIILNGRIFFMPGRCLLAAYFLFLIFGFLGVFGVSFVFDEKIKPVFIFSEPSHYAAAASIFFISVAYRFRGLVGFLMIFPVIFLAIKLQSLMLVIVAVFMAVTCYPRLCCFLGALGVLSFFILDFQAGSSYYLDRLSLDPDNLSALTLMHGWENALIALKNTGGVGVGFQQLGIYPYTGEMSAKILDATGFPMSLLDGGSLAPKIIAEFGVLGVFFVVYLLYLNFKIFICLFRNVPLNPLYVGVFFSLILELFFRGFGYFSVTFVSALYFLACKDFESPKFVGCGHN